MAEIVPFRAFHYSNPLLPQLKKIVCPPYDIISPEEQKRLLKSHAENFVNVELPSGGPAQKYANAAKIWRRWLEEGVLVQDESPALYVYEASFRSQKDGRKMSRIGFFAGLKTVAWGKGVHPHEKTLPTHKADRLKLFKAMRVQPSSIQCIFDDRSGRADFILRRAAKQKPWVDYTDPAGVRHRLWRLAAAADVSALQKVLARAAVVIADGHHRYETSRTFGRWARAKWGNKSPLSNYVMTYFSPVDDPGLEILPTHRAVGWDKRRFVNLEKWGRLIPVSGLKALEKFIDGDEKNGSSEVGVYRDGKFYRYRFNKIPPALRGTPSAKLAVACFHAGPLLGLGKEDFFFTRDPKKAVAVARKQNGWAFFLAPTDLRQVVEVASSGQVMPPKSTYFYPKIPSGLVSHSLYGKY